MKYDCGETYEERKIRLWTWHKWFAWYPVKIGDHDCRWLETIERRMIYQDSYGGGWMHKEYRAPKKETSADLSEWYKRMDLVYQGALEVIKRNKDVVSEGTGKASPIHGKRNDKNGADLAAKLFIGATIREGLADISNSIDALTKEIQNK